MAKALGGESAYAAYSEKGGGVIDGPFGYGADDGAVEDIAMVQERK